MKMFKKAYLENRIKTTFQIRHIIIEHLTYIDVKCSWRLEKDDKSNILVRHNAILIFQHFLQSYYIFLHFHRLDAKVRKEWAGL